MGQGSKTDVLNPATSMVWLAALLVPLTATAQVPKYQVLDLGTLGGLYSEGVDINDAGQVTGTGTVMTGNGHAFLYGDGEMMDLGTLGGIGSRGAAINDAGQVTGASYTAGIWVHAFLYSDGEMIDLGTLETFGDSFGVDINNAGQVTGHSDAFSRCDTGETCYNAFLYTNGEMMLIAGSPERGRGLAINDAGQVTGRLAAPFRAFLYSDGEVILLGTLGRQENWESLGTAINEAGQVTGWADTAESYYGDYYYYSHAFLYSNGQMVDLGTLGGHYSAGYAINDAGQVTGSADTADGNRHAFLYRNGEMIDLGTLGGLYSEGVAINNAGQVTGYATTANGNSHAFVYSDGEMIDLGTLGGLYSEGVAINNAGQVTGVAETADGYEWSGNTYYYQHAFIATPISNLLAALLADVEGVGPGHALADRVSIATTYYEAEDLEATCSALDGFIRKVEQHAGDGPTAGGAIPPAQAAEFVSDAQAIKDALGCQ